MDNLTSTEHLALRLRYEGKSYSDIERATEVPKRTIERWFSRNGKLSEAFREFQETMGAELAKVDRNIIDEYKSIDTVTPVKEIIADSKHKDRARILMYINDIAHGIRTTEQTADMSERIKADIDKTEAVTEMLESLGVTVINDLEEGR